MNASEIRARFADKRFILGWWGRRDLLKSLATSVDPEDAGALVLAVEDKGPAAARAQTILEQNPNPAWTERLWIIWLKSRQARLGELLKRRGTPAGPANSSRGVASRFKLREDGDLVLDAATADLVSAYWKDADTSIRAGATLYADRLAQGATRPIWVRMMLLLGEFDKIGKDHGAALYVAPLLNSAEAKLQAAARSFCDKQLILELRVLALLSAGLEPTLPLESATATAVASLSSDIDPLVKSGLTTYTNRVLEAKLDFVLSFALRMGLPARVAAGRATVTEALRLISSPESGLAQGARDWLAKLPRDQVYNDLLVEEWLRTDDAWLYTLVRDGKRLPSDSGREVLLRLLWNDIDGYRKLSDTEGALLAAALAIANEARRKSVVEAIQRSRDAVLADQFRKASLRVQGMDSRLAMDALLASGDEDLIVDAARDLNGGKLFALCRRWMDSDRRPNNPRKRAAVERAVTALRSRPEIKVEPAPPLPDGFVDLLEYWVEENPSNEQLQQDLTAEDPLVRARGLHLGYTRGLVDAATLRAKSKSEDWLERFVAALHGEHPGAADDHVYWVGQCAGEDRGAMDALVACGPEEFERGQRQLEQLKRAKTPLALHAAAEWEALQAFRSLDLSAITLTKDDAATVKSAIHVETQASPEEMLRAFGKQ